jgi:hypothetical protein
MAQSSFPSKGAAQQVGTSAAILYELIRSGEQERVGVQSRNLVSWDALTTFVDANCGIGLYPSPRLRPRRTDKHTLLEWPGPNEVRVFSIFPCYV